MQARLQLLRRNSLYGVPCHPERSRIPVILNGDAFLSS